MKRELGYVVGIGLFLCVLSVPASAHVLSFLLQRTGINFYVAWALSVIPLTLLLVFPSGFSVFTSKPFFWGALVGLVATAGLIVLNALDNASPTFAFVIEYASLIITSGIWAQLGRLAKRRWMKM